MSNWGGGDWAMAAASVALALYGFYLVFFAKQIVARQEQRGKDPGEIRDPALNGYVMVGVGLVSLAIRFLA